MSCQRRIVQHHAAADGHHRRELAQDEAVARQQQQRLGATAVAPTRSAPDAVPCGPLCSLRCSSSSTKQDPGQQHDFGNRFRRVAMKVHAGAVAQGARAGQKRELARRRGAWRGTVRGAPASCRAPALRWSRPARFSAVRWPARACSAAAPCTCTPRTRTRCPAGEDFQLFFLAHGAGDQRARHDRAEAFHGKHAVDGQAKAARGVFGRHLGGHCASARFSSSSPAPVSGADGDDRRAAPETSRAGSLPLPGARPPACPGPPGRTW